MATDLQSAEHALTVKERKTLQQLEDAIQKEMASFVRVGQTLLAIREQRLYRDTHKTFEAYCKERWEFAKAYAYRLIASAGVVEKLSPMGDVLPSSERQARPLTTIDLEEVGDAWAECLEKAPKDDDGNPVVTAKHVQETVDFWKVADEPYEEPEEEEEEEEEAFDYDAEFSEIFEWNSARINKCPSKYLDALATMYGNLAKETKQLCQV